MARLSALTFLLVVTFGVATFHAGMFPPPKVTRTPASAGQSQWIAASASENLSRIHQLVLQGPAFARGQLFGQATASLLAAQENELMRELRRFLPSDGARRLFFLGLMRWFSGIEKFFESQWIEEMAGVAESAPTSFNRFADPLTRQVAYHGLHEVGQFFVDFGAADFGCTVLAARTRQGWVIGRNFDFEAGRIFDEEKIMKWVFPDSGHAFVSVTWAGMVGAVTGVNDRGVFFWMNAAGSGDFRRFGTPSTLVVLKALQEAESAEQARAIIERANMFITDIFTVADRGGQTLYRIEKSPEKTRVFRYGSHVAIANHLIHTDWEKDSVNNWRKKNLSTLQRQARADQLLAGLPPYTELSSESAVERMPGFLRDRRSSDGNPLVPGDRRGIDALIATHGVVYDAPGFHFYVSQGPALSGAFSGFDLEKSFQARTPVFIEGFPEDPDVPPERYYALKGPRSTMPSTAEARP